MLFLGGPPLLPSTVASAIRGFDAEQVRDAVDHLNKTYRSQNRPYSIVPKINVQNTGVTSANSTTAAPRRRDVEPRLRKHVPKNRWAKKP